MVKYRKVETELEDRTDSGSFLIRYPSTPAASLLRVPVKLKRQESGSVPCDVCFCDCERLLWSSSDVAEGSKAEVGYRPGPVARPQLLAFLLADILG